MLSIVTESISNKNQIMNILSENYQTVVISVIITALITILASYFISKYYHRNYTNNQNNQNKNLKEPIMNQNQANTKEQKHKPNIISNGKHEPKNEYKNKPKPQSQPQPQPQPPQQQHAYTPQQFVPSTKKVTPKMTPSHNDIRTTTNTTKNASSSAIPNGIPETFQFFSNFNKSNSQFNAYRSLPNETDNMAPNLQTNIRFTSNQPIFTNNNNSNAHANTSTKTNNSNNSNNSNDIYAGSPMETIAKITTTTTWQIGTIPITKKQETKIEIPKAWSPFIDGLRFSVKHNQGKRHHMENSASIIKMSNNNNTNGISYSFSLFDGHLGDEAAKFCTDHLHEYVSQLINSNSNDNDIINSIHHAFHQTDAEFKKVALDKQCEAGAVGVYVYYQSDCVYVANVGDCRAILCSDGKLQPLTIDHNPKNEDEKKRCGSCIDNNSDLLSGQISVTRAIGDYYKANNMKKLDGLICDPYIYKHTLTDKDEFLIVACDGLWDVLDNKSAMLECRRSLRRYGDVERAADGLIKLAATKSLVGASSFDKEVVPLTSDNISVMVIGFGTKDEQTGKLQIGPKYCNDFIRPPGGSRFSRRRKKLNRGRSVSAGLVGPPK